MTWIVAGLIAPLLWALSNIIDQIKVRKYFVENPLLITTLGCFLSLPIIVIITTFYPKVWQLSPEIGLVFSGTALFDCLAFLAYYKALEKDEASNTVPIFQILPIMIFIMGYLFLGETVSQKQVIGSTFIVLGAFCLMADFQVKLFKWSTLGYMMLCCSVLAISTIINRDALEHTNWYTAMAWKTIGYLFFFIVMFSLNKKIRSQCITQMHHPFNIGVLLIAIVEIIGLLANALFMLSLDKAPAAGLAQTLNGFQPFFVLALGYVGYKIAPDYIKAPKTGKHMAFHLFCLALMIFGLYLIY